VTYTPVAGYSGSDSFAFDVADALATSDPATVSITVQAASTGGTGGTGGSGSGATTPASSGGGGGMDALAMLALCAAVALRPRAVARRAAARR